MRPETLRAIDDLSRPFPGTALGTRWAAVTDAVMGGVSRATLRPAEIAGRPALRLTGTVSLENNGGFVQMALDLAPEGGLLDASDWAGLTLDVFGNGEGYGLHLRSDQARRPWQSWRQGFTAPPRWQRLALPFDGFAPHRIDAALDRARLRRLGLVAIGRSFKADLSLGGLWLYR